MFCDYTSNRNSCYSQWQQLEEDKSQLFAVSSCLLSMLLALTAGEIQKQTADDTTRSQSHASESKRESSVLSTWKKPGS